MHCHGFEQLQIQGLGLHKAPTCNLSVEFNVTASHQGLGLHKEATGIFLSGLSVMLRQRAPSWPRIYTVATRDCFKSRAWASIMRQNAYLRLGLKSRPQLEGLGLHTGAICVESFAFRNQVSIDMQVSRILQHEQSNGALPEYNPTCEGLHSMVAEKHGTSHLHSISSRISCILSRGRSILSRSCWPSGHLAPLGCPALCCLQHEQEGHVFQAVGSAAMYTCPMQRCLCMHTQGQSCMSDGPGSMLRPVNSIRCTQLRNTAGSP